MHQTSYFLRRNAGLFPNRVAMVSNGTEISYKELNAAANRCASSLKRQGIKPGDKVAYVMANSIESTVIWEATQKIGACATPLNTRINGGSIAESIDFVDAKAVFFDTARRDTVIDALRNIDYSGLVVSTDENTEASDGTVAMRDFLARGFEEEACEELSPDCPSIILFTSGTTSMPKAVLRTRQMVYDCATILQIENKNPEPIVDVMYSQPPHYHLGGFFMMLKMCALGGTLICEPRFDSHIIFDRIEHYGVTQIYMIPPNLFTQMLLSEAWQGRDLSSVRQAQCAGGKSSTKICEAIFTMFPNARVRVSWGASETGMPTATLFTREQLERKPELASSVGRICANVEVKLVNDEGQTCKAGEVGEALVKASTIFAGYVKQPELTAQRLDSSGWLHTEDLLRVDEEGYYYLVDRKRDIVKTGGENVYAQEVERCLNEYPAVLDSAVIGVPDDRFGEAVAAALVIDPEADDFRIENLLAFFRLRMPGYMKPQYFVVMEELPKNSIGKIQKDELRAKPELFHPIPGMPQTRLTPVSFSG